MPGGAPHDQRYDSNFTVTKILSSITLLSVCLLTSPPVHGDGEWRVHGSDLLGNVLDSSLQRFAEDSDSTVSIRFGGSIPAMSNLRRHQSDVAIIALPEGRAKDEEQFTYLPIGFKVAVVLVNVDNPISEVSIPDLEGIFGRASGVSISRWGDLGLTGAWGPRGIQAQVFEAPDSLAQAIFQHEVLNGGVLRATVGRIIGRDRLRSVVANDVSALILAGTPEAGRGARILPVARGRSGDDAFAFGPSTENVYHGDYPLRLPFYVVFETSRQAELRPLLRYLFSNDVAETLGKNDFVPVPENFRRRFVLELDN